MYYVLRRSSWSLPAGPLGLLVALLACAGSVHAQQAPSGESSAQSVVRQFEKDLKEVEDYDLSARSAVRLYQTWVGPIIIAAIVVPAVIAYKVVIWFFSRMAATTDPEKLAMSDPWVRAQLAKQKAEGEAPPTPEQ